VPPGADIVAAYLYWATVEKSQSAFVGQTGFFNGYPIVGTILGNPNAPTSWSSGGCSGSSNGATTMRTYRADVRPYFPVDHDPASPTFGRLLPNGNFAVRLADSGSNGNTAPNALGATLVIIYRVLNPVLPLNAIVLYDGAYAPSNAGQNTSQNMIGFYQPATTPVSKLTHIVANGQPNKSESVYLNNLSQPLPSLYGSLPPFPGIYTRGSASWDNPTWVLSNFPGYVSNTDTSETTQVVPTGSNSGCVSWGAMILSTTVQASDGDVIVDAWKTNKPPGYTDAVSGNFVALPGATPGQKDLFVEVDYLSNMDGLAGPYQHSHLPKQDALDGAGAIFAKHGIHVHFDVGSNYPNDNSGYIIPNGTGGNAISESLLLCTDGATLCAFPGQSTIAWKGGFLLVRDSATMSNPPNPLANPALGNFQAGREQSYHYVLAGHTLGAPRFFWNTYSNALANPNLTQLISIAVTSATSATVTLQSPTLPPGVFTIVKPGDCPNAAIPACSDANNTRVTITGALSQTALNGTYSFDPKKVTSTLNNNNTTTTTFNITTASVPIGTYSLSNEPQLAVSYLGPTSTSGHSDFDGGGDTAVTFGLWAADDPKNPDGSPNCQGDPSQPLGPFPAYCNNQIGTVGGQEGTLLHEIGHTLTLNHGGTYYNDPNNPSLASYEPNCKSNFLSVMNYLFQIRGFGDDGYDYSEQALQPLSETSLDENQGIGAADHFTRWYGPPNALDMQIQNTLGGRYATMHCDGSPITDGAKMVRVEGSTFGSPIDWNNDNVIGDWAGPNQDVNFDGGIESSTANPPNALQGFNDVPLVPAINLPAITLTQIGARAGGYGFSGAGGGFINLGGGGFINLGGGGFINLGGGGFINLGGGGFINLGGGGFINLGGGGFINLGGGVPDQDQDTVCSTVDPPTGLTAVMSGHSVLLNWMAPENCQIVRYDVWRATGSFPTLQSVIANSGAFSDISGKTLTGTPPSKTFTDSTVKNNTTYTYFVTDKNKQGAESSASAPVTIFVKF
jgi:hypothetical protein